MYHAVQHKYVDYQAYFAVVQILICQQEMPLLHKA